MTEQSVNPSELAALDHAHVWHPFTPMQQWREQAPLIIQGGEGAELIDVDGRRYIDGVSSLWCNVHGHRVAAIDRAIREQLDRIAHTTLLGLASPPSIELAAELVRVAPRARDDQQQPEPGRSPRPQDAPAPLNKVFYSDAGATALEVAFKMAVGFWAHRGRPEKCRFIGFEGAYHGDTTGAMSVGYTEAFHRPFSAMVFPTHFTPAPDACRAGAILSRTGPTSASDTLRSHLNRAPASDEPAPWPSDDPALTEALGDHCLDVLEATLQQHAHETAAIVIEPMMQGAAGMICQPAGFLSGVADLANKYDVLLIADEVATGFGRTGRLFACEHEAVQPDLLCLAKGITGGYLPLAATLATDRIEQAFCGEIAQHRTLYHGHTYTGNPLACAAALASLRLFQQHQLLNHIQQSQRILTERLTALKPCPHVLDVRQRGLMVGVELCKDRATRQRLDPAKRTGAAVCHAMRPKGVIVRPLGDVIILMPIPAMPHAMLHRMMDVVIDTILTWNCD